MAVMKASDLVNKVKDIANHYKTLYVYACFFAILMVLLRVASKAWQTV